MDMFGYSIFCDDIRYEMGGKVSFIGVYTGVMLLSQAYPQVLPKLCIRATLVASAANPPKNVSILLYLPHDSENPATSAELPIQGFEPLRPKDIPEDGSEKKLQVSFEFVLSPFEVTKPGYIRLRAIADGEEVKLGSLAVGLGPDPSQHPY